jgi:hypothetical protein
MTNESLASLATRLATIDEASTGYFDILGALRHLPKDAIVPPCLGVVLVDLASRRPSEALLLAMTSLSMRLDFPVSVCDVVLRFVEAARFYQPYLFCLVVNILRKQPSAIGLYAKRFVAVVADSLGTLCHRPTAPELGEVLDHLGWLLSTRCSPDVVFAAPRPLLDRLVTIVGNATTRAATCCLGLHLLDEASRHAATAVQLVHVSIGDVLTTVLQHVFPRGTVTRADVACSNLWFVEMATSITTNVLGNVADRDLHWRVLSPSLLPTVLVIWHSVRELKAACDAFVTVVCRLLVAVLGDVCFVRRCDRLGDVVSAGLFDLLASVCADSTSRGDEVLTDVLTVIGLLLTHTDGTVERPSLRWRFLTWLRGQPQYRAVQCAVTDLDGKYGVRGSILGSGPCRLPCFDGRERFSPCRVHRWTSTRPTMPCWALTMPTVPTARPSATATRRSRVQRLTDSSAASCAMPTRSCPTRTSDVPTTRPPT